MPVQNIQKKDKNEVYSHVFNKGVEKRNLFNDKTDYEVFLSYLKDYLTAPADSESVKKVFTVNGRTFRGIPHQPKNFFNKVDLIAYSLMPDHFHLLIRQVTKGSLEKLIRSLCTRYAIYYNKKYQRSGSLFTGPYKSVQIKDASQLLHLTRYFHLESFEKKTGNNDSIHNGYSSYKEYLGDRVTSWIKPKVVLSFFEEAENDYFKGINGYKNFVESYVLKQNEKEMLKSIIVDGKAEDIGSGTLVPEEIKAKKEVHSKSISEGRLRTPVFIVASSLVFVLLFVLGIRNIKTSVAQTNNLLTELAVPTPSHAPQVSGAEDVQPEHKIIIIKISDGAETVNIREGPSTKSQKIGEAKDGDTFKFVSKDGEWYQIKLEDGSTAFVSERYAEIIEGKGNN